MKNSRLVYSTETGRTCPECGRPVAACECRRKKAKTPDRPKAFPDDGIVRIQRESKGRKGKTVTVVHGVPLEAAALKELAKALKRRCGTGGAVKGGVIEIQGDHREMIARELRREGYTVKLAGG